MTTKITLMAIFLCVVLLHITVGAPSGGYVHWNQLGASGHPFGRCLRQGRIVPCKFNPGPNNIMPTTRKPWQTYKKKTSPTLDPRFTTTEKTTTTTEDPETEQSKLIRERYRIARELSAENLYATTVTEADEFTSRIFDEILFPVESCNNKLPKYTDCKIQELADILQNNKCDLRTNFSIPRPATGTGSDGLNLTPGVSVQDRRRSRKRREVGMRIVNSDGSISETIGCEERASGTKNGNLRLCKTCYVRTTLPADRFPRFINEVTCEQLTATPQTEILVDRTCLTGSGVCIDSTVNLNFLRDVNNAGVNRLEDWQEYTQQIRSNCGCQILQNTALVALV